MDEINLADAKAHLSALIDRVEGGIRSTSRDGASLLPGSPPRPGHAGGLMLPCFGP